MMEPWDGPASILFCDGDCMAAVLAGLTTILQMEEQGMGSEQAKIEAFYAIKGGR